MDDEIELTVLRQMDEIAGDHRSGDSLKTVPFGADPDARGFFVPDTVNWFTTRKSFRSGCWKSINCA